MGGISETRDLVLVKTGLLPFFSSLFSEQTGVLSFFQRLISELNKTRKGKPRVSMVPKYQNDPLVTMATLGSPFLVSFSSELSLIKNGSTLVSSGT